jgi:hypothetical protein
VDIKLPRERLWDYLIQPKYRNTLMGTDRMDISNRYKGRIAPGSIYQCYHGDKLVPQTILEWQPFESMLVKELMPMSHELGSISEYSLASTEQGTRLTKTLAKPTGPIFGRILMHLLTPLLKRSLEGSMEAFARHIENDYQERLGGEERKVAFTEEQIREAAAAGLVVSTGGKQAPGSESE